MSCAWSSGLLHDADLLRSWLTVAQSVSSKHTPPNMHLDAAGTARGRLKEIPLSAAVQNSRWKIKNITKSVSIGDAAMVGLQQDHTPG